MGKKEIEAEAIVVHGWFEAVFQERRSNWYTCENC